MKFLKSFSEFLSGKYGYGSIFVFIGTTVSVILWFSGATATTSYILPISITVIGELIKYSSFREISYELRNETDWNHDLQRYNEFLTEENRLYEKEVKMLYELNRLESVIESNERESNTFDEAFDSFGSIETPDTPKSKRVLH